MILYMNSVTTMSFLLGHHYQHLLRQASEIVWLISIPIVQQSPPWNWWKHSMVLFMWWPNLILLPHISFSETPMVCFLLHRSSQFLPNLYPTLTSMERGYKLTLSPHEITWLWTRDSICWDVHSTSRTFLPRLLLLLLHKLGIYDMLPLNIYHLQLECL